VRWGRGPLDRSPSALSSERGGRLKRHVSPGSPPGRKAFTLWTRRGRVPWTCRGLCGSTVEVSPAPPVGDPVKRLAKRHQVLPPLVA